MCDGQVVMRWAKRSPAAPCLIELSGREYSFAQLGQSATAAAAILSAHGAKQVLSLADALNSMSALISVSLSLA